MNGAQPKIEGKPFFPTDETTFTKQNFGDSNGTNDTSPR